MMYRRKWKCKLKGIERTLFFALACLTNGLFAIRQNFIVSKVIDDEEDETEDVFKSNQHAQDFRLAFYDEDFDVPLPPNATEPNMSVYDVMEMKNIEVFPYVELEKEQEAKEE